MQLPQQLSLEIAQALIESVFDEARQQGLSMAAYVVDTGGHPVAFARMDGVGYMAVEVTRRKATTACNFRMPSQALVHISNVDAVVAADLAKNLDVCMVAGGVPIMLGQQCVGGLGVGGGRSEQDQATAAKALSVLTRFNV